VFIGHTELNFFCLARKVPERRMTAMTADELDARSAAYQRARDHAILRLPEELQSRFAGELADVKERAVIAGSAALDERGRLLLGAKLARRRSSAAASFH
jgi:hypothetical protein